MTYLHHNIQMQVWVKSADSLQV